jgi:hypothetical protein
MAMFKAAQKSLASTQVLLSSSFFLFFSWIYISGWMPLVLQNIGGDQKYRDLISVLQSAECYKIAGAQVYTETCGYQYGLFLLKFINFFGLNSFNFEILGFAFFLGVTLAMVWVAVCTVRTASQAALGFILVISPGPWLLFERGNFDLLIILLMFLGILLINTKVSFFAIILIAATALMKFYTLPLLLLYVLVEKSKWLKLIAVSILFILTWVIINDISSAPGFANPLFVAFGLLAPGLWVNFFAWRFGVPIELGQSALYLAGAVVFLLTLYFFYFSKAKTWFSAWGLGHFVGNDRHRIGFLFSACAYISCFLAGMNYDYRLIFLIFALLLLNASRMDLKSSKGFVAMQIGALWATYFFFGATGPVPVLLALLGNICQLVLCVYLVGVVYRTLQVSYGVSQLIYLPVQRVFRRSS